MNMGSQLNNSGGSHRDAEANGIRKMSDEEYGRELFEIKAQFNALTELIKHNEESQQYGWNLRKMVKWHVEILWARKQRQKLRHGLKEELKAIECEEAVHRGEHE